MNNKEQSFENAHQAFRAAELMRDKAEAELNTAAAEYYQERFGVKIGGSVIECPLKNTGPSLIVGLQRYGTTTLYRWRLAPMTIGGTPAKLTRYLSAEAPITVLGEYKQP